MQPGRQRAAAVKILQQGAPLARANLQAVEVGVKGIGQFAAADFVAGNRARGVVEHRSVAGHEIVPRRFHPQPARRRQREVAGVQGVEELQ